MRSWLGLRALVYLKRISKALDRIADAHERSQPVTLRKTRLAEVFTASTEKQNEIWENERRGYDTPDE